MHGLANIAYGVYQSCLHGIWSSMVLLAYIAYGVVLLLASTVVCHLSRIAICLVMGVFPCVSQCLFVSGYLIPLPFYESLNGSRLKCFPQSLKNKSVFARSSLDYWHVLELLKCLGTLEIYE